MRRRTIGAAFVAAVVIGALLMSVSANAVQDNYYRGHIAPGTADTALVRNTSPNLIGTFGSFVAWTGDGTAFYIRRFNAGTLDATQQEIPGSCNLPAPSSAKDAAGYHWKGVFIEGHTDTVYFEWCP